MAYTTIDDPSAHFQVVLWTGNTSAPRSITNDGNSNLQPDIVIAKNRSTNGTDYELYNSTMGTGTEQNLQPNNENGRGTATTYGQLTSFDTNGFTVNAGGTYDDKFNENGSEFVAWQWKVGGGSTSTNNSGNIATTVQANTTAGVSLVFYTGDGSTSGKNVGHGLGAVPKMIISKDRDGTSSVASWYVYHQGLGSAKRVAITTPAAVTSPDFGSTTPTSSVYYIGGDAGYISTNTASTEYIALAFTDVQGFSKFGAYTGNGDANGVFVYLGFAPAFLLIKRSVGGSSNWNLYDNRRASAGGGFADRQDASRRLFINNSEIESTDTVSGQLDFLSNGFKLRGTQASQNKNGDSYIYMAFAEHPLVTSGGAPCPAR